MLRLQSRVGDWELIKPGRELVKEGELHKISRKGVGSRYNHYFKCNSLINKIRNANSHKNIAKPI